MKNPSPSEQCRKLLVNWWWRENLHPCGPSNDDLFQRIGKVLDGEPDDTPESTYLALTNETRHVAVAEAFWLGNNKVQVGNEVIVLEQKQSDVLEALVELRAAMSPALVAKSGREDAVAVLKVIRNRFPQLKDFINLPGSRGKGGYGTTIQDKPKITPKL